MGISLQDSTQVSLAQDEEIIEVWNFRKERADCSWSLVGLGILRVFAFQLLDDFLQAFIVDRAALQTFRNRLGAALPAV